MNLMWTYYSHLVLTYHTYIQGKSRYLHYLCSCLSTWADEARSLIVGCIILNKLVASTIPKQKS